MQVEVSVLLIKPLRIQTLCLKTLKSRGELWEFSGVICVEVRKRTIPVFLATSGCVSMQQILQKEKYTKITWQIVCLCKTKAVFLNFRLVSGWVFDGLVTC